MSDREAIVKGTDWFMGVVPGEESGMSAAQIVAELTGATAAAVLYDERTGTAITGGTCTTSIDAATRTITVSLNKTQTAALTAQNGAIRLDVRYTTSGGVVRGVGVSKNFAITTRTYE